MRKNIDPEITPPNGLSGHCVEHDTDYDGVCPACRRLWRISHDSLRVQRRREAREATKPSNRFGKMLTKAHKTAIRLGSPVKIRGSKLYVDPRGNVIPPHKNYFPAKGEDV